MIFSRHLQFFCRMPEKQFICSPVIDPFSPSLKNLMNPIYTRIKYGGPGHGHDRSGQKAGVTRASLYKSLSENGNPGFITISKVTKALGCKLAVA